MKRAALLLFGCLLWAFVAEARPERTLDVGSDLRGMTLAHYVDVFEDPSGKLGLHAITTDEQAPKFQQNRQAASSFGYTDSAYWLRMVVRNSSASARPWLLELAYPHIDDVALYVPRDGGGYDTRRTGDLRPFHERDIAYRNFVFLLEEPARSERTYYLRVATAGSLTVPLSAWTMTEFIEHQHLDWSGLYIFYGVILVMTAYSTCLYLFTRERAHIVFALTVFSFGVFQFTYVGHTFQVVFPHNPIFVQHLLPMSLALSICASNLLKRYYLPEDDMPVWYKRVFDRMLYYSTSVTLFSWFAPYRFSIRVLMVSALALILIASVTSLRLMLRRVTGARIFFLGWLCFWLGVVIGVLRASGMISTNVLIEWAPQLGMAAQFVLLSSGLAGRLDSMRSELGTLNDELSRKVEALEDALVRAEDATQQAEALARVKSEFMATMSHELRTPLNAVINLPQGLIEDFPAQRLARCAGCSSTFELDPGEQVASDAPCPECGAASLQHDEIARYVGRPERTTHYLHKIERAGTHLLLVMNRILDEGKTEAGQFKLVRERFDLVAFAREVLDEMAELAERSKVKLVLAAAPEELPVFADPLRIRQVLINLLSNAIKFSNGHGTIRVSLGVRIDSCVVAVRDEGIGIAKDKLDRLFGTFEQVHGPEQRPYGGTGLGLSISRSLIRRHGGEVWVQSEPGRGSIFFFSIPHGTGVARARATKRALTNPPRTEGPDAIAER